MSTKRTTKKRKRPVTPEDLHELTLVSRPRISPDGSRVVFAHKKIGKKNDYVRNLWMADVDGSSKPRPFTNGGRDGAAEWSPDGAQVAFVSGRDKPKPQIWLIDAGGGEARRLTDFPEGTIGAYRWSPDGGTIAVAFRATDPDWTDEAKKMRAELGGSEPPRVLDDWWYRLDGDGYFNAQRFQLHLVDVETGAHRCVYKKDTLGFFSFGWAPDSKRLAITTNRHPKALIREDKREIVILDVRTGSTRPVPGLPPGPKTSVAWSPDGKMLAYAGREGPDDIYSTENLELWVCDPAKGRARSLTRKTDYCLLAITVGDTAEAAFEPSLQWSPGSKRVFFRLGHHGDCHLASVGRAGGSVTVHTKRGSEWDPGNFSANGRHVTLVRNTPTTPPEIHAGSLARGGTLELRTVTNLNGAWVREVALARPTAHWVTTADGTKVHTWVLLPPDHKKGSRKRYPAVLEIHGGPHAQYGVGFFHEMQVLAAAGYAVFYSNPRGSKGYGRDHCHAIRGHWGTADWVDIEAVRDFMKDHAHVDGKRMGIMGGSYGGYMTNWAIGHTRDFAGAITDRCVSNVVTMAGTSDYVEQPDRYFAGNHWDRPEERWEQSPIKYIGACKTPTLIIHSEGDLRCNVEQAEQLFVALKLLNVPTRFVRYPRSTFHGMSRNGPPDLRLHRLHQILDWWERWLKK